MIWVLCALFWVWLAMGTTWLSFLAVMMLKTHLSELRWMHKIFAYPFAAIFIVLDFLFRATLGTIMFLEFPSGDTLLFTALCKEHKLEESWRGRLARFWCKNFLNPFDPSGRHC